MRVAVPMSVILLLSVWAAPVAADEAVDFAELERAVEQTIASEAVRIVAHVGMEAPTPGMEPMEVMDASGQTTFGSRVQARIAGTILELGEFVYIADGADVYLGGEALGGLVEPGQFLYLDMTSPPPGFEDLQRSFAVGNDAALTLYWLLGVDGPVEMLGTETINGVAVTRVEVPLDLELVRSHLPAWLVPVYEENLAEIKASGADVDRAQAWLDDDGLIRRIAYDMPVAMENAEALMTVDFRLSRFGEPVELSLPEALDIVDAQSFFGE